MSAPTPSEDEPNRSEACRRATGWVPFSLPVDYAALPIGVAIVASEPLEELRR